MNVQTFQNILCFEFLPDVIVALDRGNEVAWNNPGSLKTQNLKKLWIHLTIYTLLTPNSELNCVPYWLVF
jgi:hypothetical protein